MQEQITLSEAYSRLSEIEKAGRYIYWKSTNRGITSLVKFTGRPQGYRQPNSNIQWFDVLLVEQLGTTHSMALPGTAEVIVE